jgi:signal transduction histidine kinase
MAQTLETGEIHGAQQTQCTQWPASSQSPVTSISAALGRLYAYVGAHDKALRAENEIDRARQRAIMPLAATFWIFVIYEIFATPLSLGEQVWIACAIAYSLAAILFWSTLLRRPRAGVHAQYAFLALDPLMMGWSLYVAPQLLGWFLVLILVAIVRVGFRYGLRAMKFELAFAWLGASIPLLFSDYWHSQFQLMTTLLLMLACSWGLFAPLIRSVDKAKQLEIERELESAKNASLRDSLQAKSQFLSRVSHELRSPLQQVLSALDVAEQRFAVDPAEAELLLRARRGAMALNTQVRDLLTLARGDVGKMEIDPQPFDLAGLVATVVAEVRPEAAMRGLTLHSDVPPEPTFVVADPGRIDQVLTNLLHNAIRHTPSGSVRLTLEPYDAACRRVRFSVADTGPGIDADSTASLFEPYTRFGNIASDDDGAGLGLAIVTTVLRFLDGSIRLDSRPGQGTTFHVEIPAEPVDLDETSDDRRQTGRVLVVDDRQEMLEAISSVVKQLDFNCDTAASAATAANLLGLRRYDIAFIDLDMPVKCGFDLAGDTRRGTGPNRETRLVSISAANLPESQRGWPFDGHLTKPITLQAIQRLLGSSTPAASAPR